MTLKEQIQKIVVSGRDESLSEEFVARAIILYLDNQGLSLEGNGWLDDDEETSEAIYQSGNKYDSFLDRLNI